MKKLAARDFEDILQVSSVYLASIRDTTHLVPVLYSLL
jgi:hypothetical protein